MGLLTLAVGAAPAAAFADPIPSLCEGSNPFIVADDVNGAASPCAVAPRTVQLEGLYYQNASAIGGTALAAYPMLRVRTGVLPRLEFALDAPSQVAESAPRGGGLYPRTHLGYGFDYTLLESPGSALGLATEVLPPASRYTPTQSQPRYFIGLTNDYLVSPKFVLGFVASGTSSGTVGFERVLPGVALRAADQVAPATEFVSTLGTRLIGRHATGQSFTDLSLERALRAHTLFDLGIGTTFNAVSNTKAHYVASGFDFKI